MEIVRKARGKVARAALVVVASLLCAFSISGEASAYHYYDGGDGNFSTYGSESTNSSTLATGSQTTTQPYIVKAIVVRGTNRKGNPSYIGADTPYPILSPIGSSYVQNYGTNNTGWVYVDKDGLPKSYNHSNSVCNIVPRGWESTVDNLHIGSNGVMYYTCGNDGNAHARIVDMVQYGYYDTNGTVHFTGFTGYLYCPTCSDIDSVGSAYIVSDEDMTTVGYELGTYTVNTQASSHWKGVYVYNDIKNGLGKYLISTDVGYLGEASSIPLNEYLNVLANKTYSNYNRTDIPENQRNSDTYKVSSFTDSTENGRFVRYKSGAKVKASSGTQDYVALPVINQNGGYNYAIKITDPKTNDAVAGFGEHLYKRYNDHINFSHWVYGYAGMCIHTCKDDDNFGPLSYEGRSLGDGGWNKFNLYGKCGRDYEKGYHGVCGDCGEMATSLVYGSPETVSSLRRVENGVEYYYFCPYNVNNMTLGNRTFHYLHSQVENQWVFKHACYAKSKNQYYLQFESKDMPMMVRHEGVSKWHSHLKTAMLYR